MVYHLTPRPRLNVVETRRKMARTLAHLVRRDDVRRTEQLKRHASIGLHAPLSARTAPREQAFRTVLLTQLHNIVRNGPVGLVPADPHPTWIFAALRVRALHWELDTIRMICSLNGRLPLAAMIAHSVEAGFVTFGSNHFAILDVHPHTAFDLSAAAAARAYLLDPPLARRPRIAIGKRHRRTSSNTHSGYCACRGGKLSERAPCHGRLPHTPSFSQGFP